MSPIAAMLFETMAGDQPVPQLRKRIIQRLSVDGLTRETVLGDLEDLREALAEEDRFAEEEMVLTVMDQLVGWCSPQWSLANVGISEYEDVDTDVEDIESET